MGPILCAGSLALGPVIVSMSQSPAAGRVFGGQPAEGGIAFAQIHGDTSLLLHRPGQHPLEPYCNLSRILRLRRDRPRPTGKSSAA
jgi:hypothetical protein